MLGKLIKYDLKKMSKSVIVYFIVTLISSILTRIAGNYTSSIIGKIFYGVMRGVAISCLIGIIINAAMSIWVRFKRNLYSDESYLTHTLPVTKSMIYDAKIISALVIIVSTLIGIIICAAIVFLNKDSIEVIKEAFKDKDSAFIIVNVIVAAVFEIIYAISCGFIGILIGHQSNNKKTLRSIVLGIILYYIVQTILLIGICLVGAMNGNVRELFVSNPELTDVPGAIKGLVIISNAMYLVFIAIMYFVGKKILNKGVNVE